MFETLILAAAFATGPETKINPATDTYHGVTVVDNYRWLENFNSPRVKQWNAVQNAYARGHLDHLPERERLKAELTTILGAEVERYWELHEAGGKLFSMKAAPPKEQSFLVVMEGPDAPETARTLVDPIVVDPKGTTTIDWFFPSPSGKLLAVSMSVAGTESGDLYIYDTETGEVVDEPVVRVNGGTAGGSLCWLDDTTYLYTRYPRPGERPAADEAFFVDVYRRQIGSNLEADAYEIGKDFPKIGEAELKCDHDSGLVLATVQDGDGGEFSHFLRDSGGAWSRISGFKDGIKQAYFGRPGEILLLSRRNAPKGEILTIPVTSPSLSRAETIVPEGEDTIVDDFWSPQTYMALGDDTLLVEYQTGGPSEFRAFGFDGKAKAGPKSGKIASVGGLTPLSDGSVLFASGSYTDLSAWYRYDPKTGKTEATKLRDDPAIDLSDVRVVREFATSKDGTKVPVNIMIPPGVVRNGAAPCVVYGYGGYGVNLTPGYSSRAAHFLQNGVIYAVANIRGGGEYGESWHLEGNLTNKQNVFDDFQAVVEHMIERKYTNSERVGILGGSNGGLLMGATMVQRPDLVAAVVSYVGIYDMLRVENSANGQFNITEFGTVEDPEQFEALYAYSPYHNVEDSQSYPPVIFITGENDPRVDPMQSRKMTARLQATATTNPVLLRTSADAGHGAGTALSERIAQSVDAHAFMLYHLGVTGK